MRKTNKGRKVALVAGLALVVLSVAVVSTYWKKIQSWYAFRRDFERLGNNAQDYPEYRHRQTGIVFVRLPGGPFDMGSPDSESGRYQDEGPAHRVTLSVFFIAKYEVSQAKWKKVMGNNPARSNKGDALPVDSVSWEDCQEFCGKTGLSLPTEAQWEYACRAGSNGAYAGTGRLYGMGWCRGSGGAHPIGEKQPNDFGLYDMHGNVMEWCRDRYQADFYRESTGARDPLCENSGSEIRVVRGGGWDSYAGYCRSAWRSGVPPSLPYRALGFRSAWSSP